MSGTLPVADSASIELLIDARPRDLGGFDERRPLSSPRRGLGRPLFFFHHLVAPPPLAAPGIDSLPPSAVSRPLDVHARLVAGAARAIDAEREERAIYVVEGTIGCDGGSLRPGALAVLRPGAAVTIQAAEPARIMIVGGAKLAGERPIWW